jgi:hypothetical protein
MRNVYAKRQPKGTFSPVFATKGTDLDNFCRSLPREYVFIGSAESAGHEAVQVRENWCARWEKFGPRTYSVSLTTPNVRVSGLSFDQALGVARMLIGAAGQFFDDPADVAYYADDAVLERVNQYGYALLGGVSLFGAAIRRLYIETDRA